MINKLTQILSYLRHSKRDLKRQKKKGTGIFAGSFEPEMNIKPTSESVNTITNKAKEISMYDDVGDYIPDTKRRSAANDRQTKQNESDMRKKAYFHTDSRSVSVRSLAKRVVPVSISA